MRYLILSLFFLCSIGAIAQSSNGKGKIAGKVFDSETKVPIEMAIVSVTRVGETKVLNGQLTNQNGEFTIDGLAVGDYKISIEFISYKEAIYDSIKINIPEETKDLGTVMLAPSLNQLNEVKIISKTATIQNKIDKMVFNTANDLTSQGGVATDVLKSVPMVSVMVLTKKQ